MPVLLAFTCDFRACFLCAKRGQVVVNCVADVVKRLWFFLAWIRPGGRDGSRFARMPNYAMRLHEGAPGFVVSGLGCGFGLLLLGHLLLAGWWGGLLWELGGLFDED